MKKNIPFKKDIVFKTNLSEITSISLEHNILDTKDNLITGEFIVSGEYKLIESSANVEPFFFNIPFEIAIDDKYVLDRINVDIDDFYYEIINSNILSVNIELLVDKLEEKPLISNMELYEEKKDVPAINISSISEIEKENFMEEKSVNYIENIIEKSSFSETRSLFDDITLEKETYTTYKICIIKEGDTVEAIIQKYGVSLEEVEKYNELKEIKIGDKLIIPILTNAKV